jgi:membrane protease YdiL (CAAX protease family)
MAAAAARPAPRRALLAVALIYVLAQVAVRALKPMLADLFRPETLHAKVLFQIGCSAVFLWVMFAAVTLTLRAQGRRLSDIGWGAKAAWPGWLMALLVVAFYAGMLAVGPMRSAPLFSDWSLFRIGSALTVAVTAGICEETLFRGFVMTEARSAGLNVFGQILLSAALFGLAHFGWGGLGGGGFNLATAIGAAVSTAILGALLAATYALGGRSLTPVILAHGLIDLIIEPWLMLYALQGFGRH